MYKIGHAHVCTKDSVDNDSETDSTKEHMHATML